MKKKTICIIGDLYQTFNGKNQGGGENQLVYAAKALNKLGFFVVIIDYGIEKRMITKEGIEFIPFNRNKYNSVLDRITKRCLILYRLLVQLKADYFFTSMRSYQHIIPLIVAKKQRAKFYYWVAADIELESIISRYRYEYSTKLQFNNIINILLTETFFPFVIRMADIVFVQHLNQLRRLSKKQSFILQNVTQDLNLMKKKTNYFIWVGSIDFNKNFQLLEKLVFDLKDIKIKIVGKIRAEGCNLILEKIIQNKNVEYLGYLNKNDDVLTLIGNSKALINTSYREGFPITFIEAWSLNTPVISLHVDPAGIISEYKLGFCAEGNYNAFINCIKTFNPPINNDLRKYYYENHSVNRFEQELTKYFKV